MKNLFNRVSVHLCNFDVAIAHRFKSRCRRILIKRDTLEEIEHYERSSDMETPQDLSPMAIEQVSHGSRTLIFDSPRTLNVALDEWLLIATLDEIGLHAFAYTRQELIDAVNEQITMLWDVYALAADDELHGDAINLKYSLLNAIQEL